MGAFFKLIHGDAAAFYLLKDQQYLGFLWNRGAAVVPVVVDVQPLKLQPDQMLCFTGFEHIALNSSPDWVILVFNRAFFCVHTRENEVSCNGLLFYGTPELPVLTLDPADRIRMDTLLHVLREEFDEKDENQEEMLRTLLKRFILLCTRLGRRQLLKENPDKSDSDLIRHYNRLVDEHFREKKKVAEYAAMLYKSPKTLTNIFGKHYGKTPLQVIHDRLMIEAKRLLIYTDKTAKEIGFELGFDDAARFSKFFKNSTGISAGDFKLRISFSKSG